MKKFLWIYLICLLVLVLSVDYSYGSLNDKYCDVVQSNDGKSELKCFDESNKSGLQSNIDLSYVRYTHSIFIKSNNYITVDRIAPGTLEILTSDLSVQGISISKIRFKNIKKEDFKGVPILTFLNFDNPVNIEFDAIYDVMTKSKNFKLTINCRNGNQDFGFNSLKMKQHRWKIITNLCSTKLKCDSCQDSTSNLLYRIVKPGETASRHQQIFESDRCQKDISDCSKRITTSRPIKIITKKPSTKTLSLIQKEDKPTNSTDDGLMWIVLILTTINSCVILGILIFLVLWWRKIASSSAAKKHTIILEDDDETKYMKLSPVA